MRKIDKDELKTILKKHVMWLNGEDGGERADMRGADMSWAKYIDSAKNLCPYCNGTQVAIRDGLYTQMRCEKCGARGSLADSAFEALLAWNTRAPIMSAEEMAILEGME